MIITAKPTASQRTKNRIREHGPGFIEIRRHERCWYFSSKPGILVRGSLHRDITKQWHGWLPLDEIEIQE